MQLITNADSMLMRRNTHMRSLFIEYPRTEEGRDITVALSDRYRHDVKFNLQVIQANTNGIALRLPTVLSGMYELSIKDGNHRISKWIALQ